MKKFVFFALLFSLVAFWIPTGFSQTTLTPLFQQYPGYVYGACTIASATTVSCPAGTIYNGGHAVTVVAGTVSVTSNKTDCTAPSFANCNFIFANSSGVVANTTSLGTAAASGDVILAFAETNAGGTAITQLTPGWASGSAFGPNLLGGVTGGTGATQTLTATSNQLLLGTTNITTISSTAPASSQTLTIPDPGGAATFAFINSTTVQPFKVASVNFVDGADATKILNFTTSGNTTGKTSTIAAASANTRTYTLPDPGGNATFAFSNPTSTQTITNTTLTSPVIATGLTASGSASNDFSASTGTFKTSTGVNTFGGSSNSFSGAVTITPTASLTLGTSGSAVGQAIFNNATTGTITVAPPTGALGSVTTQLPDITGGMPVVINCGSVAAAGACANTNTNGTAHLFYGLFALSGNSSVATALTPAYTSTTSYACSGTTTTGTAATIKIVNTSASSITITNPGGGATDTIAVVCVGN